MVNIDSLAARRRYIEVKFCRVPNRVYEAWSRIKKLDNNTVRFYDHEECNKEVGCLFLYNGEDELCLGLENIGWVEDSYGRTLFRRGVLTDKLVVSDKDGLRLLRQGKEMGLEMQVWNDGRCYSSRRGLKRIDSLELKMGNAAVLVMESLNPGFRIRGFDYSNEENYSLRDYVKDCNLVKLKESSGRIIEILEKLK